MDPITYKPRPYMKKAIKFMVSRGAAGLFLDPGLGKTGITLAAFKLLRDAGLVKKMLVVTMLRAAHQVWPAEVRRWGFPFRMSIIHGEDKAAAFNADVDIYVINWEGLLWLFGDYLDPFLTKNRELTARAKKELQKFDMIVLDESTEIKNTTAMRTKMLKEAIHVFKRRYILTGTPAPNSLIDLWSQLFMLDLGQSLGRFKSHYLRSFFDPGQRKGHIIYNWYPRIGAEEAIYERLRPLIIRFSDDELELPPIKKIYYEVDLPERARKIYNALERSLVTWLEEGRVSAANAGVLTHKLRQIANGGIFIDDMNSKIKPKRNPNRKWASLHREKTDKTLEIVEGLNGKPTLIAYEFTHDRERLLDALPKGTPYIGGGISQRRGAEIMAAWNRGEIETCLGQPQSISKAVNLQEAGRAVIWHSNIFNYSSYYQFNKRIHRQGQKNSVLIYHIIMRNTVDLDVMRSQRRKKGQQDALLKALETRLMKTWR